MPIKEEPINSVLNKYDLNIVSIKNESYKEKKGVWWVQSNGGYKILKKVSYSEDTLKFILSAISHLTQNGINIPKIIKTKDGSEYVNINGLFYYLSDAIEGKNPKYDSNHELMLIVKTLAKFHKASLGFYPSEDCKPKEHIGKWNEDYIQQVEEMNQFYKSLLLKKEKGKIDNFLIEEFRFFYDRAMSIINTLQEGEYSAWVDKANKNGCLCHQDFAAGNLIKTANGEIFVLDTDSITVDIPARDIRKLINKVMKKSGGWNAELTEKIFDFFQEENPLLPSEWHVVKLDIMFPHLFLGAMNKYCYKRDKEWSEEKYFQRIKEMSIMEKSKNIPI